MALQSAMNSQLCPMQSLKPTGLPPDKSRNCAMKCIISIGFRNAEWRAGQMQSTPSGTPLAPANLCAHLGARQNAAVARLGPLGELDLNHLDLPLLRLRRKLVSAKGAAFVAAAEIAAADLPDQVAAK